MYRPIRGATRMCTARRDSTGLTTFFLTAPTGQREDLALDRTSRAGSAEAGFTLLEMVCVLAIVAILAAIVIPALPRGTSRARLESYAVETAAMLKADRNAAIRNRVQVITEVDAPQRIVRSGVTKRSPSPRHRRMAPRSRCSTIVQPARSTSPACATRWRPC